nr:ABC transporter permease [uncultured Carboxylicivirga sp.]
MRIILAILQKEFLQVFRNRTMLPLIFVLPLVQLIVLVNAATMDMKNISVTVADQDLSSTSRLLISKLEASPFFKLEDLALSKEEAIERIQDNKTDVVIFIPHELESDFNREGNAKLQIITDAIDASKAQLSFGYLSNIVRGLNLEISIDQQLLTDVKQIKSEALYWFNPNLNYKYYMLPAIMAILLTIIGMFLTALNLVREKEIGTAEQINVTPIKKSHFIIGKLVPFLIIGLFELTLALTLSKLIYDLPINGNLLVLYAFAFVYLLAVLGIGLFISTQSQTQQQVMMISFFFLLVFVLLSGAFTSVDNMPVLAQELNRLNPLYYFMNVIRMVLIKGAGFRDIMVEFGSTLLIACITVPLAVFSYRKTS